MIIRKNQKAFTTLEVLVTVGLVGSLSVMALGAYQWYIPKAQAQEAVDLMTGNLILATAAQKNGKCLNLTVKGKYGELIASGSPNLSKGQSCPSGCQFEYVFSSTEAQKSLSGTQINADILNNFKLSKSDATTTKEKYLPGWFSKVSPLASDSCASETPTTPTQTEGTNGGGETGIVDPNAPVTPPGGGSNGGGDPANPNGGGTPDPDPEPTPPVINETKYSGNGWGYQYGTGPWNFPWSSIGAMYYPYSNSIATPYGEIKFTRILDKVTIVSDELTRGFFAGVEMTVPQPLLDKYSTLRVTLTSSSGTSKTVYYYKNVYLPRYPGMAYIRNSSATTGVAEKSGFDESLLSYLPGRREDFNFTMEFLK